MIKMIERSIELRGVSSTLILYGFTLAAAAFLAWGFGTPLVAILFGN